MRRIWLVGEAPARDPEKRHLQVLLALRAAGHGGRRPATRESLRQLLSKDPALHRFCWATRHVNLLECYPGIQEHGSRFPREEGRLAALFLVEGLVHPDPSPGWRRRFASTTSSRQAPASKPSFLLLAGKRVAGAFGIRRVDYLDEAHYVGVTGLPAVVVPHPSGVNRWWNDPANRERLACYLRSLVPRT